MLQLDFVIEVHDAIVEEFDGLPGFAGGGRAGVEAALARIENHLAYNNLTDVFGIAALYAVAIARGHVFNDGNKRTGLTCALTFLDEQGIRLVVTQALEELMVDVADGRVDHETLAEALFALWDSDNEAGSAS